MVRTKRYHLECIVCGKIRVSKTRRLPQHFDETKPRTTGLPERACPGSGHIGRVV